MRDGTALFSAVLCISLMLMISQVSVHAAPNNFQLKQSSALEAIRAAENAGANVTEQVAQFNDAVTLLKQEGHYSGDVCKSAFSCFQQSRSIAKLNSIIIASSKLRDQALASGRLYNFALLILSAALAAGVSFILFFAWMVWKRALFNQFLRKEVRKKQI